MAMNLHSNEDNSPEHQLAELRHALLEWNKALDNYTKQYREIEVTISKFSNALKSLKNARKETIFTLETLLNSIPSSNILNHINAKELRAHTKTLKDQCQTIKFLLNQLRS
ncbi:hypothetical protein WBJ53_22985 [Spirosoma sp. SC4-14]|uniref:hypothetical protein n=1 Tax=Spirosoma sp. SC4-14 TaxID=3128900 RepID=UPI0030D60D3B